MDTTFVKKVTSKEDEFLGKLHKIVDGYKEPASEDGSIAGRADKNSL
jgi:hypothetical protein